jgi:hypothetical protein
VRDDTTRRPARDDRCAEKWLKIGNVELKLGGDQVAVRISDALDPVRLTRAFDLLSKALETQILLSKRNNAIAVFILFHFLSPWFLFAVAVSDHGLCLMISFRLLDPVYGRELLRPGRTWMMKPVLPVVLSKTSTEGAEILVIRIAERIYRDAQLNAPKEIHGSLVAVW